MKSTIVVLILVNIVLAQPGPECRDHPSVRPSECCTVPNIANDAVMNECKTLFPVSMGSHGFPKGGCAIECFMNKTGIMKNGEIDVAAALSQFTTNMDSNLQSVVKNALNACVNEEKEMHEKFGDHPPPPPPHHDSESHEDGENGPHCSPKSMHIMGCVEIKVYENCPANLKVTSSECTKLADFISKCKPGPH